ncbi:MAG: D-alanine--D-alanine ligase, partial [Alphaproteobacteria bacterium]|nr:D-alanine--D-alanine ligase [Alphaproteobacteria bacterium]
MRILVLHSRLDADARADDLDTLLAADAICAALRQNGHTVSRAAFVPEELDAHLRACDLVFNLVESVDGQDELSAVVPALLERRGVPFTGASAAAMQLTSDKPATKRILRAVGLSTPDWCEGPDWAGLNAVRRYIVKSATADASLGLDDDAVVEGVGVKARADDCRRRFGGRWFAEAFVEGREFNVALIEERSGVKILPLAEMRFVDWDDRRPRIVGYGAKWNASDPAFSNTVRHFGCEEAEPELAARLRDAARRCWEVFGLGGYGRVDLRVDAR